MHLPRVIVLVTACLVAPACGDDDASGFELVFDGLEASLFSVWGSGADDVWVVGAEPDGGDGPLVLRYDGEAWTRMTTGATGDLWWVSGRDGEVWMSGSGGLILRYSYASDEFEVMQPPGASDSLTLFGIFPVAADDVWAVGGDGVGRVYRYDGDAWAEVDDVPDEVADSSMFKVWGRSSEDLWIVGDGNEAFHRGAEGWSVIETDRSLLTVHGDDDGVVAVGGTGTGYVVESDGLGLADVTPAGIRGLMGVWVSPDGRALVSGDEGEIWSREGGIWDPVADRPDTDRGYHAVFVDPDGGAWAVGGDVTVPPFEYGVLAYRGDGISDEIR